MPVMQMVHMAYTNCKLEVTAYIIHDLIYDVCQDDIHLGCNLSFWRILGVLGNWGRLCPFDMIFSANGSVFRAEHDPPLRTAYFLSKTRVLRVRKRCSTLKIEGRQMVVSSTLCEHIGSSGVYATPSFRAERAPLPRVLYLILKLHLLHPS